VTEREQSVRSEVDDAVEFAIASPYPPVESATEHVYT
jgi:TPP-dependent pyruvate/acetoin dehydrogenase alpha subunit